MSTFPLRALPGPRAPQSAPAAPITSRPLPAHFTVERDHLLGVSRRRIDELYRLVELLASIGVSVVVRADRTTGALSFHAQVLDAEATP